MRQSLEYFWELIMTKKGYWDSFLSGADIYLEIRFHVPLRLFLSVIFANSSIKTTRTFQSQ